ncbi:hypothetical protein GCM10027047_37650 [Rhodococcus aerolatus]
MGAYDELAADGRAGEETRALLQRVVWDVAGRRGFVPPAPHLAWTWWLAGYVARQELEAFRTGFLMGAWTRAEDDATLTRVLTDELERQLEERATGWTYPELRERLTESVMTADLTLGHDEGDELFPVLWWVPGAASTTWRADPDALDRVAAVLEGVPVERRTSGDRAVLATQDVLFRLGVAVLTAVGERVRLDDLAHLVHQRVSARPPREAKPVLTDRFADGASGPQEDGPELGVLVLDTAEQLWRGLTPLERTLVPHLGQPSWELAAATGEDEDEVEAVALGLVERLREAGRDDEHAADVLVALRVLCTQRP